MHAGIPKIKIWYDLKYKQIMYANIQILCVKNWEEIPLNIKNLGYSHFKNQYKKILLKSQV